MIKFCSIMFSFLFLFVTILKATTVKDFSGGAFTIKPRDGLYFIDIGMENLKSDSIGDLLSSFGDFNGDKYTDIVTLSDDFLTIKIYLWNDEDGVFRLYTNLTLNSSIVSIISADLDQNGEADLLVTTDEGEEGYFTMSAYKQNRAVSSFDFKCSMQISRNHPTIIDIDGDHKVDILYLQQGTMQRRIAKYSSENATFLTIPFENYVSTANDCIDFATVESRVFAPVHYNSFADMNGDCRADIFLTTIENNLTYFEFWIKQTDGTFCLVNISQSFQSVKGVAFSDIDFDGGIDMIVAREDSEALWLEIFSNKMAPGTDSMCVINTATEKNCPYDYEESNHLVYKLTDNFNTNMRLYSLNANVASALRMGDIDADTYPDLLLTLYDPSSNKAYPKSFLFKNQECSEEFCQNLTHKRYFKYGDNDFNNILEEANMTMFATFMDIGEMGSLAFLLGSKDDNNTQYVVKAIFNYLNPDTFFLKALGLNGFDVGSTGGIYYGSTFQCVITTLDGDQKLSNNLQLFQSAYNALQLPYAFIGLGRTNNYVENFYLGMPQNSSFTKSWTPIIPNSQLIVYPTTENTDNWTIDIYVNPTKATIIVVISTASILLIIGIVILYLHKKEKEEDKTYQEQFQQFFR